MEIGSTRVEESVLGGFGWSRTFCSTPEVQLDPFYITLLSWEFLLKWYNFFWRFCWNREFLLRTTIFIDC